MNPIAGPRGVAVQAASTSPARGIEFELGRSSRLLRLDLWAAALLALADMGDALTHVLPRRSAAFGLGAAILFPLGFAVRRGVASRLAARSRALVDELGSRPHPRSDAMRRRLRELTGNEETDVLVTPAAGVTGAAHEVDGRLWVEIPVGFLNRHARSPPRLGPRASESATADLPPRLDAMLAHEAGHVAARDPLILRGLGAEVAAVVAMWAVTLAIGGVAAVSGGASAIAILVVRTVVVAFGLAAVWFGLMVGCEIQADVFAAQRLPPGALQDLLGAQAAGREREDAGEGESVREALRHRLIRFFLHPDIHWRQAVTGTEGDLGARLWLFLSIGLGASMAILQSAPRGLVLALSRLAGATGPVAAGLGIAGGVIGLLIALRAAHELFWRQATRRSPSLASRTAHQLKLLVTVAACSVPIVAIQSALRGDDLVPTSGTTVLFACIINVGFLLAAWAGALSVASVAPEAARPSAGYSFIAALVPVGLFFLAGVASRVLVFAVVLHILQPLGLVTPETSFQDTFMTVWMLLFIGALVGSGLTALAIIHRRLRRANLG